MTKTFIKMHGLGNDFAIFDGRAEKLSFAPETIRALADRRTGIGFDQMVVMEPGKDVSLRIFNADGSEVGACGNATRCIAKLLAAELKRPDVVIGTKAGQLKAHVVGGKVTVDMGAPKVTDTLPLEGNPVGVDVGNPHAVFFVPDAAAVALEVFGPKIENDPLFPERTNVEVAQVLSPDKIRMRVWERGAGITQACGTGACAVAVAAVQRGLTGRKVTVVLDGGELVIEWRDSDGHVLMTGDAAEVYRGSI